MFEIPREAAEGRFALVTVGAVLCLRSVGGGGGVLESQYILSAAFVGLALVTVGAVSCLRSVGGGILESQDTHSVLLIVAVF